MSHKRKTTLGSSSKKIREAAQEIKTPIKAFEETAENFLNGLLRFKKEIWLYDKDYRRLKKETVDPADATAFLELMQECRSIVWKLEKPLSDFVAAKNLRKLEEENRKHEAEKEQLINQLKNMEEALKMYEHRS